jgi:hypothetical protein
MELAPSIDSDLESDGAAGSIIPNFSGMCKTQIVIHAANR